MKRIRWYTRNPIQTKYLIVVFLAMLLPLMTMTVCFSYFFKLVVDYYSVFPPEIYQSILALYEQLKYFWAVSLTIIFSVMLLISLYVSHRLVGPFARLERDLDKVITGDLSVDIRVRSNDDMKGIVDRINQIILRLKPR